MKINILIAKMVLLLFLSVPLFAQTNQVSICTSGISINVWNVATGGVSTVSLTNISFYCTGPDLSGTNNPKFYPPNTKK